LQLLPSGLNVMVSVGAREKPVVGQFVEVEVWIHS
jgi:hypothetical protein